MTVYVDTAKLPLGRMLMCHMLADTLEELHTMAATLQLKPEWFQEQGTPHYDICQSKRALAIKAGAVVADRVKVVELIRKDRRDNGKVC